MKQLYRGRHLIHYGQVALWDREDRTSYPLPEGPMPWRGPKGLVVPALSDAEIDLTVYEADDEPTAPTETPSLLVEVEISVGSQGIEVGNVTTAMTAPVPWPAGRARVRAYFAGASPDAATAVSFVLSRE